MVYYIRDTEYSSYHLSGILVDAFVYEAIGGWHFRKENEQHVDSEESYEQALVKRYNDMSYGRLIEVYTFLTACAVYPRGRKSA